MKRLKGFKHGLKKHLADATSLSAFVTPIKAVTDQLAGMTEIQSIESRAKMTALNYLGLVKLLELRDWSKKKTRIAKTTNKSLHYLHDIGFALTVGVPIQTGVYLSSGVDDWKKIAASIGASFLVTSALAGPGLQVIDTFREITRVKKSKNTPAYFKRLSDSARKKWVAGFVASSLVLTGAFYLAISNKTQDIPYEKSPAIEQRIETQETNNQGIYSQPILEEITK